MNQDQNDPRWFLKLQHSDGTWAEYEVRIYRQEHWNFVERKNFTLNAIGDNPERRVVQPPAPLMKPAPNGRYLLGATDKKELSAQAPTDGASKKPRACAFTVLKAIDEKQKGRKPDGQSPDDLSDNDESWGTDGEYPLRGKLDKQLAARALAITSQPAPPKACPRASGYFVIKEQGGQERPARSRSLQSLNDCANVLYPIKDSKGDMRGFAPRCNCEQCREERGAYYCAQYNIEDNKVKLQVALDSAANVTAIDDKWAGLFYGQNWSKILLGGFDTTQVNSCRGFSNVQVATTTRRGERQELPEINVVTAPFFKGSLLSVMRSMQEGDSYIFGAKGGAKISGKFKIQAGPDKVLTKVERDATGMWVIDIEIDGQKKPFVMDSESNVLTLDKSFSQLASKYPKATEEMSGYNDLQPIGAVQIIENLSVISMDTKGVAREVIIDRAVFGKTIHQNLIPLQQLIKGDQDLVVLDKDGGWIINASLTMIKMTEDNDVTDIRLVNGSYVMDIVLDATRLKEFLKLPLPERREEQE